MTNDNLILQLFEIGSIRLGNFTLKSGIHSPIYLDLRRTISQPQLLIAIAEALYIPMRGLSFDFLCGVPYTALPFATAISIAHHLPMIMRRKEKKEYGTAQMIEGIYQKGQRCLIVEDIITSGSSILETAHILREEGLLIEDAVVLINREQGGVKALANEGLKIHSILTLTHCLDVLFQHKKIELSTVAQVKTFLASHQVAS